MTPQDFLESVTDDDPRRINFFQFEYLLASCWGAPTLDKLEDTCRLLMVLRQVPKTRLESSRKITNNGRISEISCEDCPTSSGHKVWAASCKIKTLGKLDPVYDGVTSHDPAVK
ncbi:unnamed protein product [Clavelina lepadiformis]|uniref:Uncharacterized protein n=1 Tax=Clavelina lepadiformis TaxID=159417 RepID=A0ABP0H3G0_CLALP